MVHRLDDFGIPEVFLNAEYSHEQFTHISIMTTTNQHIHVIIIKRFTLCAAWSP